MYLHFRQGLVSFQSDLSGPQFLQPSATAGFIEHVVSPKPTILNFAHKDANYLVQIDVGTPAAWGPIPSSTAYLYWDIDLLTANVTRGFTLLEPIVDVTPPASPANDQHWFDLSTTTMKVYRASHSKWTEVVRVFAGSVNGGSISNIRQNGAGSQVNIDAEANTGYIVLDSMLRPVRLSDGTFMTADTPTRLKTTAGTAGTQIQPASSLSIVRAETAIPRMTAVYLSGQDLVSPASSNPALSNSRRPIGLITVDLIPGELGQLVQFGEVIYDGWDFSTSIGKPLFCDDTGQLTTTRPAGDVVFRVGFVKNATTVIFQVDAEATVIGTTSGTGGSNIEIDVQGTVPISVTSTTTGSLETFQIAIPPASTSANGYMTAGQVSTQNSHGTRITDVENALPTKSDVWHAHPDLDSRLISLEGALPTKSDAGHTHTTQNLSDIVWSGLNPGDVMTFNGAFWTNQPVYMPMPVLGASFRFRASGEFGVNKGGAFKSFDWNDGVIVLTNNYEFSWDAANQAIAVPGIGLGPAVWDVTIKVEISELDFDATVEPMIRYGTGLRADPFTFNDAVCPDTFHTMLTRVPGGDQFLVGTGKVCWTDTHTLISLSSGPFLIKPGVFFRTGENLGFTIEPEFTIPLQHKCDMVVTFKYVAPAPN